MITGEIKNIYNDLRLGTIVVETEYKNGNDIIQLGRSRYDENSGTNSEIIARAKSDVKHHCENIIRRIDGNQIYIAQKRKERQTELTESIIDGIKSSLVGYTETADKAVDEFKGKIITVTDDSKNTIKDK